MGDGQRAESKGGGGVLSGVDKRMRVTKRLGSSHTWNMLLDKALGNISVKRGQPVFGITGYF